MDLKSDIKIWFAWPLIGFGYILVLSLYWLDLIASKNMKSIKFQFIDITIHQFTA